MVVCGQIYSILKNKGGFREKIRIRGEIDSKHRLVQMYPGFKDWGFTVWVCTWVWIILLYEVYRLK